MWYLWVRVWVHVSLSVHVMCERVHECESVSVWFWVCMWCECVSACLCVMCEQVCWVHASLCVMCVSVSEHACVLSVWKCVWECMMGTCAYECVSLCVHMCICVCRYVCIYMYQRVCVSKCVWKSEFVHKSLRTRVCVRVCAPVCTCESMNKCVSMCVSLWESVCVYLCVHVYMCVCTHTCFLLFPLPSPKLFSQGETLKQDCCLWLPISISSTESVVTGRGALLPSPPSALPPLPAWSEWVVRLHKTVFFFFFPGGHTYLFVRSYSLLIPEIFIKVSSSIFQLVEAVISPWLGELTISLPAMWLFSSTMVSRRDGHTKWRTEGKKKPHTLN